jgi:hypothetical protein
LISALGATRTRSNRIRRPRRIPVLSVITRFIGIYWKTTPIYAVLSVFSVKIGNVIAGLIAGLSIPQFKSMNEDFNHAAYGNLRVVFTRHDLENYQSTLQRFRSFSRLKLRFSKVLANNLSNVLSIIKSPNQNRPPQSIKFRSRRSAIFLYQLNAAYLGFVITPTRMLLLVSNS